MKRNLKNIHTSKFFYGYIYPVFPKEFLFGNDYETFAKLVSEHFILNQEQWESVLNQWDIKEMLLSSEETVSN